MTREEQIARALHYLDYGPWVSGGGLTEGGTPWGTSREKDRHEEYLGRARTFMAMTGEVSA